MGKHLALFLLCTTAVSCATQGAGRPGLPLGPTTTKAPPTAWQKVQLVEVTAAPGDVSAFAVDPNEALGKALIGRIGSGSSRPVTLQVSNVRVAATGDERSQRLGLGADFTLRTSSGEKTLRLEHSVNLMKGANGEAAGGGYARLVDDLCDRLFYHPEALAFLMQEGQAPFEDSALSTGAKDLGPVQGTSATAPGIEGSGRILWGEQENADNGMVMLMLGDTKMFSGMFMNRNANIANGLGFRAGLGGVLMPGKTSSTTVMGTTVDTSTPTFFGFMFQVGMEIGYHGVARSPEGYVLAPGFSALLVPQGTGFLMTGSSNGQSMSMRMVTVGGAAEVDLPIGSSLGVVGTLFVGATATSISAGGYSFSTGFSKVVNPSFDIYTQSATGRVSLGLGLQTLAQAASGGDGAKSLTKNPMLMFTWQDWVGRGMAYSKQELEIAGLTLNDSAEILSSPKNAFMDDQGNPRNANAGGAIPTPFYPLGGPVSLLPTTTTYAEPSPPAATPPPVVTPPPPALTPSEPAPKPAAGQPERKKLGLRFRDLTADYAREVGLEAAVGAEIIAVAPGSPAADAELAVGDVILAVDGVAVANADAVRQVLATTETKSTFEIRVWHGGSRWIRGVYMGPVAKPAVTPEEAVKDRAGAAMDELENTDYGHASP